MDLLFTLYCHQYYYGGLHGSTILGCHFPLFYSLPFFFFFLEMGDRESLKEKETEGETPVAAVFHYLCVLYQMSHYPVSESYPCSTTFLSLHISPCRVLSSSGLQWCEVLNLGPLNFQSESLLCKSLCYLPSPATFAIYELRKSFQLFNMYRYTVSSFLDDIFIQSLVKWLNLSFCPHPLSKKGKVL